MTAIRAIVRAGKLELEAPPDWPDGTEVLIEPMIGAEAQVGIDEAEWRDDPASLAEWDAWIETIEPLEFTPEEAARIADFNEQMRRYNIEAVRQEMERGVGE